MKTKTKAIFKSESALQAYAVKELYKIDASMPIIANPHSSMRNMTNSGMSERQRIAYFAKVKGNNKAQGFQEGQSDLIICAPEHGFHSLAIELKTEPENPFKPMRGKPGSLWIKESSDNTKVNHVVRQLTFIANMRKKGNYGIVCAGKAQLDLVLNWYFRKGEKPITSTYKFMTQYYETHTIEYII